jgi:hypothetical protein
MGSTTRDGIQYTGKCGCGAIEFEMAEGADAAVIAPNCACNDCVSSAHWCDKMAKAKGVKNISAVEEGNPQVCMIHGACARTHQIICWTPIFDINTQTHVDHFNLSLLSFPPW